jgi:hypothetical protein
MQEPNLYHIFVSRLNSLSVDYMVTGAAASIIYGEPRLTNDIDLVIALKSADIEKFFNEFPSDKFYCPPIDVIVLEVNRTQRGHFNLIHHGTGFKADMYTSGRDELNHWGLRNRKLLEYEADELWLAPIEYVILRKLDYYREGKSEKHLRDISGMLAVSHDRIDFAMLSERIKKMDLDDVWSLAKEF